MIRAAATPYDGEMRRLEIRFATRVRRVAAAALGVFVIGCGPPAEARDAGLDALAAPDAWRFADAGIDAPDAFETPDAFEPNDAPDPEWQTLEGQPDGVIISTARHPERVLSLAWETCGTGCLRAEPAYEWFEAFPGTPRTAWVRLPSPLSGYALMDVESGRALAAWRHDADGTTGLVVEVEVGGDRVAFVTRSRIPGTREDVSSLFLAPLAEIAHTVTPVRQMTGESFVDVRVSATHHAFRSVPANETYLVGDADSALIPLSPRIQPEDSHLVGDRLFFIHRPTPDDFDGILATATIEAGAMDLVDVRPDLLNSFRTDGLTMLWYRGHDYTSGSARERALVVAPFATDPPRCAPQWSFRRRGRGEGTWAGAGSPTKAPGPTCSRFTTSPRASCVLGRHPRV